SHRERRGTQQYVFRVDSSNKVLLQGWTNGYGRIPDRIENAVTLNAIVVNAATGTDHDLSLSGGVPGEPKSRPPLRMQARKQILVNAGACLTNSVERVAGSRHLQTNIER